MEGPGEQPECEGLSWPARPEGGQRTGEVGPKLYRDTDRCHATVLCSLTWRQKDTTLREQEHHLDNPSLRTFWINSTKSPPPPPGSQHAAGKAGRKGPVQRGLGHGVGRALFCQASSAGPGGVTAPFGARLFPPVHEASDTDPPRGGCHKMNMLPTCILFCKSK